MPMLADTDSVNRHSPAGKYHMTDGDKTSDNKPEYLELPHPVFICYAEHDEAKQRCREERHVLSRFITKIKRLLKDREK